VTTQDQFTGCLLGAAIGDAMGMPGEGNPVNLKRSACEFRKAWRGHPNDALQAGQYTDDTQVMLLVAEMVAERRFTAERYARALRDLYRDGLLRFPDGSLQAACEHLLEGKTERIGVLSTTAGCVPVAVPYALSSPDPVEVREQIALACSVTHTHPAAIAAAITVGMLLHHALHGSGEAISLARKVAAAEDQDLGEKIRNALQREVEGMPLERAITVVGNDVSVYQTLPLAFFLLARFDRAADLLATAAHVGGNTDTIGFICGAYTGARYGKEVLPANLVEKIENRQRIVVLAQMLHEIYNKKP
jgi:ADP-ribosylglycohydrolase